MTFEELGESITGGNAMLSNLAGKLTPMMQKAGVFLKVALYIAGLVAICLAIYQFYLRYNKKAIIFMTSGGKVVNIKIDKAMIEEDKKSRAKKIVTWSKVNNIRLALPLIEGKYKYLSAKRDTYIFWLDDNMQLQPAELEFEEKKGIMSMLRNAGKKAEAKVLGGVAVLDKGFSEDEQAMIKIRPAERDAWMSMEKKVQQEKLQKESWMTKYGPLIVPIVAFAVIFLIFYFGFQELGAGMNRMAGAFDQIAQNCLR